MANDSYLGMRPGDLEGMPYAKYWNPEMAALAPAVAQALLQSPYAASEGLLFSDSHRLLDPGRLSIESGFTRLSTGEVYVAVNTPMPGASGEMIDWWFGWHSNESQRYKLWHPRAHMKAKLKVSTADRPALPKPFSPASHQPTNSSSTCCSRSLPKYISSPTKKVGMPKAPRSTAAAVFSTRRALTAGSAVLSSNA